VTEPQSAAERGASAKAPASKSNIVKNHLYQGMVELALPRAEQVPLSDYCVSFDENGCHLRKTDGKHAEPLSRQALDKVATETGPVALDLVFEGESCIDLSFSLPDAPLPELHRIIEHEVAFRSPFSPEVSYSFWVGEEQADGRWRARAAVLLRAPVDDALGIIADAGFSVGLVRRVSRNNVFAARPLWAGHAPAKWPSVTRLPAPLLMSLFGAIIFCASAIVALASSSLTHSQLSDQAAAAQTTLAGQAQAITGLTRLDEALQLSTEKLAMTGTLSALLPDGVWLDQLIVDEDTVTMIGYAPSAAEITRLLSTLPELTDIRFASPVTRDNTQNLERFRIAATLAKTVP